MYIATYLFIGLFLYLGSNRVHRREKGHNLSIGPMTWVVLGWPVALVGVTYHLLTRRDSSGGTNNGED